MKQAGMLTCQRVGQSQRNPFWAHSGPPEATAPSHPQESECLHFSALTNKHHSTLLQRGSGQICLQALHCLCMHQFGSANPTSTHGVSKLWAIATAETFCESTTFSNSLIYFTHLCAAVKRMIWQNLEACRELLRQQSMHTIANVDIHYLVYDLTATCDKMIGEPCKRLLLLILRA